MGDFRDGKDAVFQHLFSVGEAGFDQELVGRTAGDLAKQPPEMGVGDGKFPGFIRKTPVQQRLAQDLFPQQLQFAFAESIDADPHAGLFLQLQQQILQHPGRPRLHRSAGLADQLIQLAEDGIESLRINDLDQRVFPVQFQQAAGNEPPDQSAAETDEAMMPVFPRRCAVIKIRPRIGEERMRPFDRDRLFVIPRKKQAAGMIVLNAVISAETAGMGNPLGDRQVSVRVEDQFFIIFHDPAVKMSIFLFFLSIILLKNHDIL